MPLPADVLMWRSISLLALRMAADRYRSATASPRRAAIMALFRERQRAGLPPPTIKELAAAIGVVHSVAAYHLSVLWRDGKLVRVGGFKSSRRYTLPPKPLAGTPWAAALVAVVYEPGRIVFEYDAAALS